MLNIIDHAPCSVYDTSGVVRKNQQINVANHIMYRSYCADTYTCAKFLSYLSYPFDMCANI